MGRRLVALAFKVAVTVALVATLATLLDLDKLVIALQSADRGPIMVALIILLLRYPFMGWRWRLILEYQGYALSTLYLTKVTLASVFFSLLLPSGSGGDIVRGIYLARQKIELRDTVTSIVCDRFVGFLTLLAIAIPSAGMLAFWYPPYRALALAIFATACCFAIGLVVVNQISKGFTVARSDSGLLRKMVDPIGVGLREIMAMTRDPSLLLKVVLLTILLQAIGIYSVYLLGLAVQANLGLVFYAGARARGMARDDGAHFRRWSRGARGCFHRALQPGWHGQRTGDGAVFARARFDGGAKFTRGYRFLAGPRNIFRAIGQIQDGVERLARSVADHSTKSRIDFQ